MQATIDLYWVKDTKNTAVYHNSEEGAAVTQLYVQKTAFPAGVAAPKITLTITAGVLNPMTILPVERMTYDRRGTPDN